VVVVHVSQQARLEQEQFASLAAEPCRRRRYDWGCMPPAPWLPPLRPIGLPIAAASACGLMLISQSLPLVLEHLPDARDLGLFKGANISPMVLAPALAWLCVVHPGGYTTLFGVVSLLIAASLLPLRVLGRQ
jgi:hypothetical protein